MRFDIWTPNCSGGQSFSMARNTKCITLIYLRNWASLLARFGSVARHRLQIDQNYSSNHLASPLSLFFPLTTHFLFQTG